MGNDGRRRVRQEFKNGRLQETSAPSCLCADLQWKTKKEKQKNMEILLYTMFCCRCYDSSPLIFPSPHMSRCHWFQAVTAVIAGHLDSQTGPDI